MGKIHNFAFLTTNFARLEKKFVLQKYLVWWYTICLAVTLFTKAIVKKKSKNMNLATLLPVFEKMNVFKYTPSENIPHLLQHTLYFLMSKYILSYKLHSLIIAPESLS